ncbi:MAG: hypothetical protein HY543_02170 [Deltaproteobacteria bacterium]|nr:hypothetical protein [Deltaproteobacteria bacterium]
MAKIIEDRQGRIRGAMMVIVVQGYFADQVVPFAWISSGVVDEEARAMGAGAGLYCWVYQSFPLVGAMSGNQNSRPINAALGLDIPGVAMERFIAVHRPQTAELCPAPYRDALAAAIARWPSARPSRLRTVLSAALPDDYEELWQRARRRFVCCVERDAAHMAWRYTAAPHVTYQFLAMRSGSALTALAVLRFQPTPAGAVCRVVDFIADDHGAQEAWSAVRETTREAGALCVDFMMIGTDQTEALRRSGFQQAGADAALTAIPHLLSPVEHRQWSNTFHLGGKLAKADQRWRHAHAVYFTKGDSDRDWPTTFDLEGSR